MTLWLLTFICIALAVALLSLTGASAILLFVSKILGFAIVIGLAIALISRFRPLDQA